MFLTKFQQAIRHRKILFNFILIFLTLALILVGGLTRLTESGLSMVDWQPIQGIVPPISEADWQREFEYYQQFPEYNLKNKFMSLAEFKIIFYFEYFHRILARLLGMILIIIFFYFIWKKQLSPKEVFHYVFLISLVGAQGLLGWYMVKSGLVDDPKVSHYRLLAHLLTALFFLTYLWLFSLSFIRFTPVNKKNQLKKWPLNGLLFLLILQISLGALNSGLDGGFISNDYPKMLGSWLPSEVTQPIKMYFFDFFSSENGNQSSSLSPLFFLSDAVFIHFFHRHLGIFLAILCILFSIYYFFKIKLVDLRIGFGLFLLLSLAQPIIGIYITVFSVPVVQASLHQMVAVLMLMNLFYLRYRFR